MLSLMILCESRVVPRVWRRGGEEVILGTWAVLTEGGGGRLFPSGPEKELGCETELQDHFYLCINHSK